MGIFIALYFVIIAFSFLEINVKTLRLGSWRLDTSKLSFWIITIVIMLIGILKDEYLGVDAGAYETYYFNPAKYRSWSEIILGTFSDKGFYILSKILILISDNYWVYNALIYIIIFAIEAYVIYKNSEYPAVSYLVFVSFGFVVFNYSILRQALAISICFYAFRYVKEKSPLKFVLWTLLAMTFHQTAILFLIAYPVANWNIKGYAFWKKCILFIGALLVTAFMPSLFQFYLKHDYSESYVAGEGYFLLLYLVVLVLLVAWMMHIRHLKKEGQILYNVLFCVLYFQIGATAFSLFTRAVNYFLIALILIVPFIIKRIKRKNIVLFLFTVMLAFRYMLYINGMEYISIWG